MFKKTISLLLAVVLILGAIPMAFAAEGTTSEKMLYLKTSESSKELLQRASVEVGNTYYFTFSLSSNISFAAICRTDDSRIGVNANIQLVEKEDKDGYSIYTYSYTIPENDNNGNTMTDRVFFAIRFTQGCEGYFFNTSVYNVEDESKTELFDNPDFSSGLDGWAWGWEVWFDNSNNLEWSNDATTLKVIDLDESFLKNDTEKALYIKTSESSKELLQRASVEVGKTYYFTFGLSYNISFTAICRSDTNRIGVNANIQLVEKENKGGYSIYTYSYTIPETDNNGNAMTASVFFAIRFTQGCEGYFFNASVYNVEDESKTELFDNSDFSSGLDRWAWSWDAWFAPSVYSSNTGILEWSNDTTTLKVVDYDESLEKTMLHVRYECVDMTDDTLVQKVENVEADVEYTISFNYHFVSGELNQAVCFAMLGDDGDTSTLRDRIFRFSEDNNYIVSTSDDGINVKYTFKLDSTVTESYESFYVGLYFEQYTKMITEFYISDLVIYKSDDSDKNNLLGKKSFFEMGGWYSNWVAASEGSENFGSTTVSYLDYIADYVAYDEDFFTDENDMVHYGDINFDDTIDIRDLVALKKHVANLGDYISSFDCNADNGISAEDLTVLKKHLIGIEFIEWEESKKSCLQASENLSGGADSEAEALKSEIISAEDTLLSTSTSNVYYISENGKYSNNGFSENNATTVEKLRDTSLVSGDVVLFKRGEIFRIESSLNPKSGVSYGAYGNGNMPQILGSLRDYADSSIWTTGDGFIWQTTVDADYAANLVFNKGEYVGVPKLSLSEVNDDGEFYFDAENKIFYLYLRQHNPGCYFDSIEISSVGGIFVGASKENVTIENLCFKYAAIHAINLMTCENFKISGCEIGWIGGAYTGDDAGSRYGNGIQFWDKATGCEVSNNYLYQIYDAALTFQGNDGDTYSNLTYTNNLIEYTSMNFEFWDSSSVVISNINFTNNILRFAGYGFSGVQRSQRTNQAFILGWYSEYEEENISNFNITGNIFDVANCRFFYATAIDMFNVSCNIYYQNSGSAYSVLVSDVIYPNDQTTFENAIEIVDSDAIVYWLDD